MTANLMKEDHRTSEVVCQRLSQTMVESDIIVPDVNPDMKKVLEVSGTICLTQRLLQQDKVFLQGTVKMTVLYLPDDTEGGMVKNLIATREFNHTIDCRGVTPDMQLMAEATIENIDHTLINSRKLNLRCVVGLGIKVTRPLLLSPAIGVENPEGIALRKERIRLLSETDRSDGQIILREQLEIPSGKPTIGEILRITATPSSSEFYLTENKAVAKGQLRICTLYNGEDNSLQFMEHLLPFSEILDLDGATEGMMGEIDYHLTDLYCEIRENADGEARSMGIEAVLSASLCGREITEVDVICDGYFLRGETDLVTKDYPMEQLLDRYTAELSHKDQAQLPPMLPALHQVCDLNATATMDRVTVNGQEATVHGVIRTNILYLTEEENLPVASFSHLSEFSHTIQIPQADSHTLCDGEVILLHSGYTISGNNALELRFVLGLTLTALKNSHIRLVESLTALPEESPVGGKMVLYFVQQGDTLWELAKRYHTTIDAICRLNHLESDHLALGQQLKILTRSA